MGQSTNQVFFRRISLLEGLPEKVKLDRSSGVDNTIRAIDDLNSALDLKFLLLAKQYKGLQGYEQFVTSMLKFFIQLVLIDEDFKKSLEHLTAIETSDAGKIENLNEWKEQFDSFLIDSDFDDLTKKFPTPLKQVSREVYACGIPTEILNSTTSEIQAFRRMFIQQCSEYRVDVAPYDFNLDCALIKDSPSGLCKSSMEEENCSIWKHCEGKISCENLRENITVCFGVNSGNNIYVNYSATKKYKLNCEKSYSLGRKIVSNTSYSRFRPPITEVRKICEPCQCVCQRELYYLSVEIAESKWRNGSVIVGARLQIVNNTLIVQIKQGKLSHSGGIIPNSTHWLPPKIGRTEEIPLEQITAFDLTNVLLPKGRVMTGLGLWKESVGLTSRIRLMILSHVGISALGHFVSLSVPIFNVSGPAISEIEFSNRRSPTAVRRTNPSVFRRRNKFVRLTVSNGKDGGQSTIPFIDPRDVIPNPLTALAGAGLYWRGGENLGGFIGIELLTYNFLPFLDDQ
ncbi:hypothetical protein QAD02_005823 [Eretmocerus hayati]|uniref:Uncharacterized protein n=1 Tax=Eretmocerus hayati TaxID=131215 RepID=A0ACC2NVC1_9HYME|nr:hypothetical protein QAD02_005823 [Eretmocerus hayati]